MFFMILLSSLKEIAPLSRLGLANHHPFYDKVIIIGNFIEFCYDPIKFYIQFSKLSLFSALMLRLSPIPLHK
jgi:hypothetical protein